MAEPVILELAVNGATLRHRNRHVPRTPAEITEAALAGIESGASIVHNHNDEPMFTADGVHAVEPYLAAWQPVLDRHPDALLYPTMAAGARGIPVTRRWAHVAELARRGLGGMTLVDPGSVNLGLTSASASASAVAVAPAAAAGPYANSLADVEYMFARSGELGAAPSISVFEPGFLRTTLAWQRSGRLPPGAMVKLYFGGELEFGLRPTATALEAYLELLEPSNLDLLRAAVALVEGLGRAPATVAPGPPDPRRPVQPAARLRMSAGKAPAVMHRSLQPSSRAHTSSSRPPSAMTIACSAASVRSSMSALAARPASVSAPSRSQPRASSPSTATPIAASDQPRVAV